MGFFYGVRWFWGVTEWTLLGILAVTTYSLVGLLAIWAGLGRPHWFLRFAVVGSVLSLGLLIPAYGPVLLFFTQSVVVIVPLLTIRTLRGRDKAACLDPGADRSASVRARLQFGVRDLLLATVVASAVFAVAANAPKDAWHNWLEFGLPTGVISGILTLTAAWAALGRGRLWLRLVVLGLIPIAAAVAGQWLAGELAGFLIVLCLVPVTAAIAGWLAMSRAAGYLSGGGTRRPVLRRVAKVTVVLFSLLILLPPAAVYYMLLTPPPIVRPSLPDPNGYGDLIRAGKLLENVSVPYPDDEPFARAELQAYVRPLREVFDTARIGLDRECRVPLQYTMDDVISDRNQAVRELHWAFFAEGKLADMDGRTPEAIRSYLDLIRLGRAAARGGLLIDRMYDWPIEGKGVKGLAGLRKTLTPDQCRQVIHSLQSLNANRESLDQVLARDRAWQAHVWGWPGRLLSILHMIADPLRASVEESEKGHQSKLRLLICELAIRCFRVERGHLPRNLGDLVPAHLPAVPEDPFSNKPLIYRPNSAGYLLYSVGPDGCDDGGQPLDFDSSLGDVLLDEVRDNPGE